MQVVHYVQARQSVDITNERKTLRLTNEALWPLRVKFVPKKAPKSSRNRSPVPSPHNGEQLEPCAWRCRWSGWPPQVVWNNLSLVGSKVRYGRTEYLPAVGTAVPERVYTTAVVWPCRRHSDSGRKPIATF